MWLEDEDCAEQLNRVWWQSRGKWTARWGGVALQRMGGRRYGKPGAYGRRICREMRREVVVALEDVANAYWSWQLDCIYGPGGDSHNKTHFARCIPGGTYIKGSRKGSALSDGCIDILCSTRSISWETELPHQHCQPPQINTGWRTRWGSQIEQGWLGYVVVGETTDERVYL